MKLRMKGSSIRLRLTQSEVARLRDQGRVEEACDFGNGRTFRYAVESQLRADAIHAVLDGTEITVTLPAASVRDWASNTDTGIYASTGTLEIAIEKDFRCLSHSTEAGEADAFPNPAATC